jgi:hypothetical protein
MEKESPCNAFPWKVQHYKGYRQEAARRLAPFTTPNRRYDGREEVTIAAKKIANTDFKYFLTISTR